MTNPESEEREVILLVDDDPVARVLTASVLESHGLEVVDVESGEHAIARFESVVPHCVVLDALMPGLDGFDTCRRLRALPGGAHHRVNGARRHFVGDLEHAAAGAAHGTHQRADLVPGGRPVGVVLAGHVGATVEARRRRRGPERTAAEATAGWPAGPRPRRCPARCAREAAVPGSRRAGRASSPRGTLRRRRAS